MTIGELYTFRYRAYNQLGWSDFSDTITVALGPLPDQVSAPVKASTDNSETQIKLQWSALENQHLQVLYYTLYMDDGFGVTFNKVNQEMTTEFTVTQLTPGVQYSFKVSATNYNGEGALSEV